MWVDLLISAPVTLFLLWLYWYSAPRNAPALSRAIDRLVMLVALLVVVAIIAVGHARIDFHGMGLNVMLVACAYLSLIFILGLGWLQRALVVRGNSDAES